MMSAIEIPENQVVPIDDVAQQVHGLRILFVNVYSISHSDGSWTLVDTGLPLCESKIRAWAEARFGRPPNAIVLTHRHFDHAGSTKELSDRWQVPVLAHPLEFPYLTGRDEYPAPNMGAGGGLMTLLSPFYPRGPLDLGMRLHALPPGDASGHMSAKLPDWEIWHTPGHTPGHISLFRRADKTLLAGDAFCTTKPESFFEAALAQEPELHGPPAYFTWDWNRARESVAKLAELAPTIVAPGHGKPLASAAVPGELRSLAANFDAIAIPQNRQQI
ncbi:MAG TPA: MBL fold metallo-hydrolase [Bryobacteraceae bacterium]|jgi:glyoxylase-like metal-dependent hydrolase (beta-lactamase superfamily II)